MPYELPPEDTTPTQLTWKAMRTYVYQRDGGICHVCDEAVSIEDYECGHIVDRVAGGLDHPANLVTMCGRCNQLKPVHDTRHAYEQWINGGHWRYDFLEFAYQRGALRFGNE